MKKLLLASLFIGLSGLYADESFMELSSDDINAVSLTVELRRDDSCTPEAWAKLIGFCKEYLDELSRTAKESTPSIDAFLSEVETLIANEPDLHGVVKVSVGLSD